MAEITFHSTVPVHQGSQIYLRRKRIDGLLGKAIQKPVVIVSSGAGYGKSRAVYSFAHGSNINTFWIQLSQRDNAGGRFWENFVAGTAVFNRHIHQRISEMEFPSTAEKFERYLKIPLKENNPKERLLFIFDDLHLITDEAVLRFIERSVVTPFPNISSILISRQEPAFNLRALESEGLLGRITEEDLKFTKEEMISYFRLEDIEASPETLLSIYRDTEGWAFAVHLAGLSLRNRAAGREYIPLAMRPNIFKLIESEVMRPLPEKTRRFLIKLSLIENLDYELVKTIADDPSLPDSLEKTVSFIYFDAYRGAYRIHHLFLDYLKSRQNELSEGEKTALYAKSAAWCAGKKLVSDAVSYYEKAADYKSIASIFSGLPLTLSVPDARFILDLLERLPQSAYRKYPVFTILKARSFISLDRYAESREEILARLPFFEALGESPEKHRVLMDSYISLGFVELVLSTYTKAYNSTCSFKRAARERRLADYTIRPPANGAVLTSHCCRVTDSSPETINGFIAMLDEIVPYVADAAGGCMSGLCELARGELAFFREDHINAEKYFLFGLKKGRENRQYEIENRALFYLLRIYLAQGNNDKVKNVLKEIEAEQNEPLYLNRYFHYDIVMGWYYIQTGKKDDVAAWLKSDYEESDFSAKSHGLERLVKAKYNFSRGRFPSALASLLNHREAAPLFFWSLEAKVLEAVSLYRVHDKSSAYEALREAYMLAVPGGFFFPFTELGKDMRTLTEAAMKDGTASLPRDWLERIHRNSAAYAKKVFALTEKKRAATNASFRALSSRELEVLSLLAQGLTREEIAGSASLSVNTVKSVIRGIYNKLGAINRADAVRIAVETGILH